MSSPPSKLEQIRIEKLRQIEELGVDPWGSRFDDRTPISQLLAQTPAEPTDPQIPARTAGRILTIRDKGKLFFIDLADKSGKIQLMAGKNQVGEENWAIIQKLDLWDLIGVEGNLGKSRTGEPTIFVQKIFFLTKTVAHPPEKYHGAQDIELRLRRRYVDMIQNPAVLARFETRANLMHQIRGYFAEKGFLEVETPTMQAVAGGAAARPFITHHNALDIKLYLRIAPELYLKRLLVGGMERVFEIARVFRNEGIDASHNPEFTLLEAYQAYGDYRSMMDLTEGLFTSLVRGLSPEMKLPYGDKVIDFTPPWRRATYSELFAEHVGVEMENEAAVLAKAKEEGIETAGRHSDLIVSDLFERFVEDALDGPIFVIDYPATLCPLTKRKTSNPRVAERFELFIQGMELANAYTELNDPLLQEELFAVQLQGQKEEDSMAKMDKDFVLALRHGMPPAGGLGVGVDRLIMLLTDSQTIRDVIIFPLMRPEREPGRPAGVGEEAGAGDQEGAEGDV